MKTKLMIGAAAVLTMLSGQAVAATAPASALSTNKSVRAGTVSAKDSKAAGSGAIVVGVLAAAAVVGAVILIADDDDSDSN